MENLNNLIPVNKNLAKNLKIENSKVLNADPIIITCPE
jgi:hypothetical protein